MVTQTIGYLPGQDPGDMQANEEYQQALQRMLASLDARKNRMFDPTMLAMAQGFLAPTKTGSFGESLGSAVSGLRAAQEEEAKFEQDLAQQRLALEAVGCPMHMAVGDVLLFFPGVFHRTQDALNHRVALIAEAT